ncbi:MAG TPA: hypothetical protein ENN36_10365 [Candidatus Bathyarchaeota archaeon]|nr:hypothetical protein [Candidatus Bathyarchaeota archaeon]
MMVNPHQYSASDMRVRAKYEGGTVTPISSSQQVFEFYSDLVKFYLSSSASVEYSSDYLSSSRCVKIDSIVFRDRPLELVKEIPAIVSVHDNRYVFENNELGIFAVNQDFDEGLADFKEGVSFLLSEYGDAVDDDLTDDAKELKRKILSYVNG